MKAIVKAGPGEGAELAIMPTPHCGGDEVLIKVRATSICGTDVHIYKYDNFGKKYVNEFPHILGHEVAGEIVKVGGDVKGLEVGDYVSAETHIPCGHCVQCAGGQGHICANLKILGIHRHGAFAEYISVPGSVVWKNSPGIEPEFATVQEPLGNAVYCALVEPVGGKSVLIIGDGPTSLLAAGVARAAGAGSVVLLGLQPYRLDIARRMGADSSLQAKRIDPHDPAVGTGDDPTVKAVLEARGGEKFDVVLEMVGAGVTIKQGLCLVRKGGRFSAFGLVGDREPIVINDWNTRVVLGGITIYGINGRLIFDTWHKLDDLLSSGALDISPVVTHLLALEEFEKGFKLMTREPIECGKVVLFPDRDELEKAGKRAEERKQG
jgi:threonine 3-dehydrogenase